jgi:hypothetical protein
MKTATEEAIQLARMIEQAGRIAHRMMSLYVRANVACRWSWQVEPSSAATFARLYASGYLDYRARAAFDRLDRLRTFRDSVFVR